MILNLTQLRDLNNTRLDLLYLSLDLCLMANGDLWIKTENGLTKLKKHERTLGIQCITLDRPNCMCN